MWIRLYQYKEIREPRKQEGFKGDDLDLRGCSLTCMNVLTDKMS
jgi:hypothetical protein